MKNVSKIKSIVARLSYAAVVSILMFRLLSVFDRLLTEPLQYEPLFSMYSNAKWVARFFIIVFVIISTLLLKRITTKTSWFIAAIVMYVISLEEVFFNFAFNLRAEFGATWTSSEVRSELVFAHWEFWAILGLSTIVYIGILLFYKSKNCFQNGNVI